MGFKVQIRLRLSKRVPEVSVAFRAQVLTNAIFCLPFLQPVLDHRPAYATIDPALAATIMHQVQRALTTNLVEETRF